METSECGLTTLGPEPDRSSRVACMDNATQTQSFWRQRREKSGQAVGARSPSLHSPCLLAPQTPSPLCNGPGGRFLTLSLNENKKGEAETRDQRQTPGRRLHLHLVDDGELHCRLLGRHRPARHESNRS